MPNDSRLSPLDIDDRSGYISNRQAQHFGASLPSWGCPIFLSDLLLRQRQRGAPAGRPAVVDPF
jgi:hypothetical protein